MKYCYDMNEPRKHYAKQNKPEMKGQLLYGSTYLRNLEYAKT